MRLGMIGAGAWGSRIVSTLTSMSDVQLAVLCKRDVSRLPDELPRDCVVSSSPARALESDALIVATPPDDSRNVIDEALRHGIPVFVEKPATCDAAQLERWLELKEAHGVPLVVDYIHLFSEAITKLRELRSGLPPTLITSIAGNAGPVRSYSALFDWGPHDLALAYAFGGPGRLVAARRTADTGGAGERFQLSIAHESGAQSILSFGNDFDAKRRYFRLEDKEGSSSFDDLAANKLEHQGVIVPLEGKTSPLHSALRYFIEAARTKREDWRSSAELTHWVHSRLFETAARTHL